MLKGRLVFASGRATDFDVWCVDLASGRLTQLTSGEEFNTAPRWSPDGSQIVYLSTGPDLVPSVWIMNGDGSGKRCLTKGVYCQSPSWSPDGRSILFVTNGAERGELDVCSIPATGGAVSPVFQRRGLESEPRWSPEGTAILFSGKAEPSTDGLSRCEQDIYEFRSATRTFHRLTDHPAEDVAPCYSPDGAQIAFISRRNGRTAEAYDRRRSAIVETVASGDLAAIKRAVLEFKQFEGDGDLHVMNRDGSNVRALTHDDRGDAHVCWSPCSQYLAYSASADGEPGRRRIRVVEVETGAEVPLRYDRRALEAEIGVERAVNSSFWQKLVPNFIERRFVMGAFFGEECCPDWTA
jgi:Tol biopolymer transport system component